MGPFVPCFLGGCKDSRNGAILTGIGVACHVHEL